MANKKILYKNAALHYTVNGGGNIVMLFCLDHSGQSELLSNSCSKVILNFNQLDVP